MPSHRPSSPLPGWQRQFFLKLQRNAINGRQQESAFGAFIKHFPQRSGFVVQEITVSTENRPHPPNRLQDTGARGRRPAAKHRAGKTEGAEQRRVTQALPSLANHHPRAATEHRA